MAGVTRLREGRGGVDGVSSTSQHISRIQELGVGYSLRTQVYTVMPVSEKPKEIALFIWQLFNLLD